ncbi:hypothetical protein RRG08_005227 [Elysia crispata]|uniref:Uncharacterized protein n=1 Tax=Elysia crispata TaxID=231223 RepID=A0AAE1ALS2_9GAST|nr:hypothetical protein RRG08_005227 [Elysia crispata]
MDDQIGQGTNTKGWSASRHRRGSNIEEPYSDQMSGDFQQPLGESQLEDTGGDSRTPGQKKDVHSGHFTQRRTHSCSSDLLSPPGSPLVSEHSRSGVSGKDRFDTMSISDSDTHGQRQRDCPKRLVSGDLLLKQGSDLYRRLSHLGSANSGSTSSPTSAKTASRPHFDPLQLGSANPGSTSSPTTAKTASRPHFDPLQLVRTPTRPRSMPCSPHSTRRMCSISGPDGVQYVISGELDSFS